MKKLCLAFGLWLGLISGAFAQQVVPPADTINCAYNFCLPTLSSGQMGRVQCDSSGRFVLAPASNTSPSAVKIVDGTNGPVAVKPASTAPVATDPAVVVAISPNGNQATAANQAGPNSISVTNPTSTLTLPSTTTAYTAGTLICTSATVATCNTALASQTITIANSAGAVSIPRLRLTTNDATSTAWGAQTVQIDLWAAAPTFATTGDRGNFVTDFATGSAGHIGAYTCVVSAELADGAYSECYPQVGNESLPKLASGTSVFWTAQAATGSGATGASKIFTLTAELRN